MSPLGLAELFRRQGEHCLPGSPLYHALLVSAADDIAAGGVTAEVMSGHEADLPDSLPALRLMAAVHRLVLQRRAPELAAYYPSVGGAGAPGQAWPAFRRLLAGRNVEVRDLLDRPVQTNDVGRSAALFGGLLVAAHRTGLPIRLLEVGASAGLNLRVEHFCYQVDGFAVLGDPASEVQLADPWVGWPPATQDNTLTVASRRGCDPAPIDPATNDGRLTLTSYVWADWLARLQRLQDALAVAARVPAEVDRAHADEWLSGQLAEPQPGVVTVVWHSVVWQYLGAAEQERARQVLLGAAARATSDAPLAHLTLEPRQGAAHPWSFELWLWLWPGLEEGTFLGRSPGHGMPIAWA
ncbi:MAG: DUF2332 domain-containing protein [Pseudonocardiales bacterium]